MSEKFPERLVIVKIIGYGTGVIIYRVKKAGEGTSKTLALKVVNRKFQKAEHIYKRLLKEATILREVQHPNIVGYMGHLMSPVGCLLMMEELDRSLGDYIDQLRKRRSGPMPPEDICRVLNGVCRALDYLHSEKYILHGDVKSHNILIKEAVEEVKLCDFGLSVRLGLDGTCDVGEYVGTLCWAPPEALGSGRLTTKADMFSLGMVVYEMLAMTVPIFHYYRMQEGTYNMKDRGGRGPNIIIGSRPGFPRKMGDQYYSLVEIFSWCTETDCRFRPSAKELLQVLESRVFTPLRVNRSEVQDIS